MIKAISKTLPPAAPPPPKPTTPETEARSSPSSTSSPKYKEFTCDYCTLKVGSDDPRPKYTFKESDMGFCSEACREAWKKNDRWWKDWEAKQKKEAQEWENYKCQQDQKWNEYFRNLNNSNYRSYSTYTSPTSSGSGSSISNWLKEWQERRDKQRSEDLTENKKRYIRDVEFSLSLKKVSDQQLNQKLGVSNWRDRINQAADDWEAWSRKFEMENLVDKLRREYTCAGCGAVKDNYYPYEKGGKKYCSLDCRDGKEKGGKREISELRDHLKDLGGSVEKLLGLLLDWIKREKPVEIRLEGNKLVIKKANGKTENLEEKDLTPAQLGLKKYLERSAKKSLNQSELESLVEGTLKEEKTRSKRKDLVATIGGIFIFIVILAIIIGIVVWISKKTKK